MTCVSEMTTGLPVKPSPCRTSSTSVTSLTDNSSRNDSSHMHSKSDANFEHEHLFHFELRRAASLSRREGVSPQDVAPVARALINAASSFVANSSHDIFFFDDAIDLAIGTKTERPRESESKVHKRDCSNDRNLSLTELVGVLASRSKSILARQQDEIRCLRLTVKELIFEMLKGNREDQDDSDCEGLPDVIEIQDSSDDSSKGDSLVMESADVSMQSEKKCVRMPFSSLDESPVRTPQRKPDDGDKGSCQEVETKGGNNQQSHALADDGSTKETILHNSLDSETYTGSSSPWDALHNTGVIGCDRVESGDKTQHAEEWEEVAIRLDTKMLGAATGGDDKLSETITSHEVMSMRSITKEIGESTDGAVHERRETQTLDTVGEDGSKTSVQKAPVNEDVERLSAVSCDEVDTSKRHTVDAREGVEQELVTCAEGDMQIEERAHIVLAQQQKEQEEIASQEDTGASAQQLGATEGAQIVEILIRELIELSVRNVLFHEDMEGELSQPNEALEGPAADILGSLPGPAAEEGIARQQLEAQKLETEVSEDVAEQGRMNQSTALDDFRVRRLVSSEDAGIPKSEKPSNSIFTLNKEVTSTSQDDGIAITQDGIEPNQPTNFERRQEQENEGTYPLVQCHSTYSPRKAVSFKGGAIKTMANNTTREEALVKIPDTVMSESVKKNRPGVPKRKDTPDAQISTCLGKPSPTTFSITEEDNLQPEVESMAPEMSDEAVVPNRPEGNADQTTVGAAKSSKPFFEPSRTKKIEALLSFHKQMRLSRRLPADKGDDRPDRPFRPPTRRRPEELLSPQAEFVFVSPQTDFVIPEDLIPTMFMREDEDLLVHLSPVRNAESWVLSERRHANGEDETDIALKNSLRTSQILAGIGVEDSSFSLFEQYSEDSL